MTLNNNTMKSLAFCGLFLLMTSCATSQSSNDQLYLDLGGTPGIATIVESFLGYIADDLRIVKIFAEADISNLRSQLITQFCDLSGGPCEYRGRTMSEAHVGLDIDPAEFNALVEDLQKAMTKHEIPIAAQNRLLALLAPMRDDILHR